jgi:hypothetical protein
MSLTMTVSDAHRSLRFDWPAASSAWAREVAPAAKGMMRAHAPFRTGKLRSTIDTREEPSAGRMWVVIYATASYAPYVIGGTGPHVIAARNARALRWLGRGGIGVSFARSVNHPGTKPNPFPETAMAAMTPMILSRFAAAVKEATIIE